MWVWLGGVVGLFGGGALGLFAPVVLGRLLSLGSGSYEDFLIGWLLAIPLGAIVGGWLGARLARRLVDARAARR